MDDALLPPLPRSVQIEPVGQCNLRCRMCPVQFRTDGRRGAPAFMQFDTFRSLLDQFEGMAELHLQGLGEPMLHPRFFDMVELAVARGIQVSTNTNLTVMTEEQAERCVTSGLHALHVSIDAAQAEVYDRLRVGAHLPLVLRNLRRVAGVRRQLGWGSPDISLVAVLMRSTLEGLPDLVRLAAGVGVSALSVQQLCHDFSEESLPPQYLPMRDFVDGEMLGEADRERAQAVFEEARAAAQQHGIALKLPHLVPRPHAQDVPGRSRCDWPWREAYVTFDGQAMPCCMVATPDRQQLGHMGKEGVAAVWHGEAYQQFRARLASADPPPVCAGCAIYRGTF